MCTLTLVLQKVFAWGRRGSNKKQYEVKKYCRLVLLTRPNLSLKCAKISASLNCLAVSLVGNAAISPSHFFRPGCTYVSFAVLFTRKLGVGLFFVCVIAGMLLSQENNNFWEIKSGSIIASMMLDELGAFGTIATRTSGLKALGVVLTFCGAACVVFTDGIEKNVRALRIRFGMSQFVKMSDSDQEMAEIR